MHGNAGPVPFVPHSQSPTYAAADLVILMDRDAVSEEALMTIASERRSAPAMAHTPLSRGNASFIPRGPSPPFRRIATGNAGRHHHRNGGPTVSPAANGHATGVRSTGSGAPVKLHRQQSRQSPSRTRDARRAPGDGWGPGLTELKQGQIFYDETEGIDGFYSTGLSKFAMMHTALSLLMPVVVPRSSGRSRVRVQNRRSL